MKEDRSHNIEKRIERLEQKVARLEKELGEKSYEDDRTEEFRPLDQDQEEFQVQFKEDRLPTTEKNWIPDQNTIGENWLNWLGIVLLLLGVVFLFKYSIDQGWLIPPVRSAFGIVIGTVLLAAGLISQEGTTPRQILLGGGIAAYYITGFATFQLYEFMTSPVVWFFMVGVTILALFLATRHDEVILSVIGTVGGLGTPFMLYSGDGSLLMLILYTSLILTGSGALYFLKGWKSLLLATIAGGWLVMLVGWFNSIYNVTEPVTADRWTLQAGALFTALVSWILPEVRELVRFKDPEHRLNPVEKEATKPAASFVTKAHVQVLAVIIPVVLLFYSYGIWSVDVEVWGFVALVGSLVVGYSYLPLRKEGLEKLALAHGFTSLILITISLFLLLDGEILLISLTLEALCLRIIAAKTGDLKISVSSHSLFAFIGIWMMDRMMMSGTDLPLLNLDALTELFIIGIGGLMVPGYLKSEKGNIALIYGLVAHLALLGWFMKELTVLQDGQAYVTVAWGIYGLLILFAGFFRSSNTIRFLGMATIFVVVGKLFLVDLTQISTLLRILLFIGLGGVFLAVSYFLQKRWGNNFNVENENSDSDLGREGNL